MATLVVSGGAAAHGVARVPGDKSISHRGLLFAGMACGSSVLRGLGSGHDVRSTRRCLQTYGVSFDGNFVVSEGIDAWSEPAAVLDCGNSGTTMRILAGLAARRPYPSVLDGDRFLRRRPMDRIAAPLRSLGASVTCGAGGLPPVRISGGRLCGATIAQQAASAQVKSCVLLAGLGASGRTTYVEPVATRDHTERMLAALGVPIFRDGDAISVEAAHVPPFELDVPGDPSSAAFVAALGALTGCTEVHDVALNPGRTGFFSVLEEMGAEVDLETTGSRLGEPTGRVRVGRAPLSAVKLDAPQVPPLVDELPLVAVAACAAQGETSVTGAGELRLKETDRITAILTGLTAMGAYVTERPDGFTVAGPTALRGADVSSYHDHRIAMALAVAGACAAGSTRIHDWDCVSVSWPGFESVLAGLGVACEVQP